MVADPKHVDSDVGEHTRHGSRVQELPFDHFYNDQYPRLVRVLLGMTGRSALAEDLAQEALLAAHRDWRRIGTLDRPDLWVRRVAVNGAISARRRLLSEVKALTRVRPPTTDSAAPSVDDAHVWVHVHRLPRRQAAAIVLWAVEQRTLDEIGDVLGCSGETARTHLRRARETLRRMLREEEDNDG